MAENSRENAIVAFQARRNIVALFKSFLEIVERQKNEHDESLDKLRKFLPDQYKKYVDLADYFTDAKFESLRKEILGKGNDTIRAIEIELENVDFKGKK